MNFIPLFPGFNKKAFTLSYDDGVIQDKLLVEYFNKLGFKCTFNINTGLSGTTKFRNDIDCSIMRFPYDLSIYKGHEIATHTYTHPHLEDISMAEQYYNYKTDIEKLEKWLGKKIIGSAYPYGTYSDLTLQVLKDLNIKYARTVKSTYEFHRPYDFLLWHPTIHHRDKLLMDTIDRFLNTNEELPVFYLWGHGYEFALDDNFSLIEEIGKRLHQNNDIWYATNGEIYEYYKAMDLVLFKANNKVQILTNYSNQEIYGLLNGERIKIMPHQKINFEENV